MDSWNDSPEGSGALGLGLNLPAVFPAVATSGVANDQRINERELKKQQRMQSNRESARRSRQRKQADLEELQYQVTALENENQSLKDELWMLSQECERLASENNKIKGRIRRQHGQDALTHLDNSILQ